MKIYTFTVYTELTDRLGAVVDSSVSIVNRAAANIGKARSEARAAAYTQARHEADAWQLILCERPSVAVQIAP